MYIYILYVCVILSCKYRYITLMFALKKTKKQNRLIKRKQYFVNCPSEDTVCTYLQYLVNNVWGEMRKNLLCYCVSKNNLCTAVQQLESVSVFIKMSLTIFTTQSHLLS